MNPREKGFLLLTSHLGNPDRRVLTPAQLRTLADRVRMMPKPESDRDLEETDLVSLGYGREMAERIIGLLAEEDLLHRYCARARQSACQPVTRVSDQYPKLLRKRLMPDQPGCLWAKGDMSLLETACISLVGSRDLNPENQAFAEAVGYMAARKGFTLVSGNARGADRTAQESCLRAGGKVISIVADELEKHPLRQRMLYLSEDGFDEPFSSQRALSRNRCIHALGQVTFVAQVRMQKGGTWDGTAKNLRHGWSPVICFRDGSEASQELEQMGAYLMDISELEDFSADLHGENTFF